MQFPLVLCTVACISPGIWHHVLKFTVPSICTNRDQRGPAMCHHQCLAWKAIVLQALPVFLVECMQPAGREVHK
eukprot:1079699-Amphidinium_carterae.1